MNLPYRIDLLVRLGEYMLSEEEAWQNRKLFAFHSNGWFTPEFIELAIGNITHHYLNREKLEGWAKKYAIPDLVTEPKSIGIVMPGNLPLVGFHDLLAVFISGHRAVIKLSSKDEILIKHLVEKLCEWEPRVQDCIQFAPMLKGCDAYIATGSNNTSRYFEYYFGKYPHIIRHNRSSVAVLEGSESPEELAKLSDDVYQYFGLGCRNVTKIMVPRNYDFVPILDAFNKYNYLADHHKYKNNYDYNLAMYVLNKVYYMTNGTILLIENESVFSPVSQLNYEYYDSKEDLSKKLRPAEDIQCIVGRGFIPFGNAQIPGLDEYADGIDTLNFLLRL